jgi:hypothetical protein
MTLGWASNRHLNRRFLSSDTEGLQYAWEDLAEAIVGKNDEVTNKLKFTC